MKNLLLSILSILTITAYGQLVPTTTNVSAPQPPSITGKTGNIFSNSIKNTNGAGYAAFAASVGNSFGAGYTSLFGTDPNKNAYIYNSRGLLIPRLTTVQRDAVTSPQTGLLIYQTDGTAGFYYYNGSAWGAVGGGGGSGAWSLTGNSGTDPNTNFIGTSDASDLLIKSNNIDLITLSGSSNYALIGDLDVTNVYVDVDNTEIRYKAATQHRFTNDLSQNLITIAGTGEIQFYTPDNTYYRFPLDTGSVNQVLTVATNGVGMNTLEWQDAPTSGTYTPTLNGITNIDALTPYQCQYLRVGNNVTVSGMLLVDVTNTATDSEFTITLPIASTFSSGDFGIGGAGSFINIEGSTALVCGPGDTFGTFRWLSSATTTTAQRISFTFTYQIL